MRISSHVTAIAMLLAVLTAGIAAQQVTKSQLPGVRNYARLETTVACAGAISAEQAVPAIKREGFVSIVSKAAGLLYFHVPRNGSSPDPNAADAFIATITTPGAEPAFIHCSGGNRAATMWMIKRMVFDRWDAERATKEAIRRI